MRSASSGRPLPASSSTGVPSGASALSALARDPVATASAEPDRRCGRVTAWSSAEGGDDTAEAEGEADGAPSHLRSRRVTDRERVDEHDDRDDGEGAEDDEHGKLPAARRRRTGAPGGAGGGTGAAAWNRAGGVGVSRRCGPGAGGGTCAPGVCAPAAARVRGFPHEVQKRRPSALAAPQDGQNMAPPPAGYNGPAVVGTMLHRH